jgi:hypothetical protein
MVRVYVEQETIKMVKKKELVSRYLKIEIKRFG